MPKNPGFRVVFVTDQHLHDFLPNKFVNEYMQKINALKPDLLLLGGDFIIDDNTRFNNLDVLSQLGNFPKLAVLGNHDFNIRSLYHQKGSPTKDQIAISKRIIKYLEGFGIKVLENDNYDVNIGNQQKLNIFGLDCLWAKKNDLSKFKASNFNFLLTHHPEIFDNLDDKRFDLVLAGHNHGGGNIKLNQKISVHNFLRLVSKKWKNDFSWHVSGLYKNKYGLKMHLSRGLGLTGLSMRINCPMEVTVIDIV